MTYSHEMTQSEGDVRELAVRMAIVLSLILSLTAAAILSKHQLTKYLWVDVAALTVPLLLASYFRDRIVSLRAYAYVGGLIVILGSGVLFGM